DELLEHRDGIELGREHAAGTRELLREPARDPFRFEGTAARQRRTRRLRHATSELEIVGRKRARLADKDDDQPAPGTPHPGGEQRFERTAEPGAFEALVVPGTRGRDDSTVRRSLSQRRRYLEDAQVLRQVVRTADGEPARFGHQDGGEGASEGLA